MQKVDLHKRNFLKLSVVGIASLFVNFFGIGKIVKLFSPVPVQAPERIGLLYSSATGIILRTVNPGPGEQHHLEWLDTNKPQGTALLKINKSDVGADDHNCPNLDFLIPYVKKNLSIPLSFGQTCAIADVATNKVVDVVLCCPVLYQEKLNRDAAQQDRKPHLLIPGQTADIGHIYNPIDRTIFPPPKLNPNMLNVPFISS